MAAARRGRLQVPRAVQVGIFMLLWEQYSLATSQTKNKSLNHTAKPEKMLHAMGPSICLSLETNTPCLVFLPKLSGGLAHTWALAVSQEGCILPATSRAPVTPHSLCPHHGQASVQGQTQEQKPSVKHQAPAALHLATLLFPWYLPAQIPFYLAQPGRAAGQEPSKADSRWVATALRSTGAAAPVRCSTTAASA